MDGIEQTGERHQPCGWSTRKPWGWEKWEGWREGPRRWWGCGARRRKRPSARTQPSSRSQPPATSAPCSSPPTEPFKLSQLNYWHSNHRSATSTLPKSNKSSAKSPIIRLFFAMNKRKQQNSKSTAGKKYTTPYLRYAGAHRHRQRLQCILSATVHNIQETLHCYRLIN